MKRKPPSEVTVGAPGFFETLAQRQPWLLALANRGSVNGFGARWIDFHDGRPDGSAVATQWLIAAFFPIAPLIRARIRVVSQTDTTVPMVAHVEKSSIEQLEQLHVDARRTRRVYAFYYGVIAPLMLLPAVGGFVALVAVKFQVDAWVFWLAVLGILATGISAVFLERRTMGPPRKK